MNTETVKQKPKKPRPLPPAADPDRSAILDIVGRNLPHEVKLCMIVLHYADGVPMTSMEVRDRAGLSDAESVRSFEFLRAAGLVSYDGTRYVLRD